MNNIPHGYDENGVRSGIDGDGDYDKGEIELSVIGEDIKQIVIDILGDNGIEVI